MAEPALRLRSAPAWRAWLEAHHATEAGAVLRLSKKAVPRGLHYEEALEEALCFGWIDGTGHALDADHFLLRFSPRKADSVWSQSNRKRVTRLIRAGRMRPAGLAAMREGKRSGHWQAAYRVARVPRMPRDLREALQENPTADSHFRAWTPTYRSASIYFVTEAKREETRLRRIRRVVRAAAADIRPGMPGF